jgi:hypothetical protein
MISIVTATRNDAYDGDSLHRNQIFISSLVWLAERYGLDAELIVVEWDPPGDRPSLEDAIRWPARERVRIRILVVPHEIHERVENSHLIPFFQMQAKNVGVRRAEGEWILCTNADLLYSHELMDWLATADRKNLLDENGYYRVSRHDTDIRRMSSSPELLYPGVVDLWIEACRERVTEVHEPPPDGQLFTNACGDFTMAHRDAWHAVRGYAEIGRWSPHVDSLFLIAVAATGREEHRIEHAMYHLRHDKALVGLAAARTKYPYPTLDPQTEFEPWRRLMLRGSRVITPNGPDWGFMDDEIEEIEI